MTNRIPKGPHMSNTTDDKTAPATKTKGKARKPDKVLRSQKQPASVSPKPAQPAPKPMQTETVKLASGEQRSVSIEATNDKEWNDLATLAEGATALSLDHKDITHRTIAAIAALRVAHEDDWKSYCESRGLKWRKEAKSPFQCAVMWVLNRMKTATGESHTSKASMIAGCLDEYWEIHRSTGIEPSEIAAWLDKMGGYTAVYRERLDRLRDPKDKIAERYGRYLALPPLEQRGVPDWLAGFDGEVVISAHINRHSGKLEYRSVWQPEGSQFWYSKVDQFIAARDDYGKAAEPVRPSNAGKHIQDGDAWPKADLRDEITAPADAVPAGEANGPETGHDNNPSLVETDFRARLDRVEAAIHTNIGDVMTGCITVESESDGGAGSGPAAALDCRHPSGRCRYGGCAKQGHCLHQAPGQQPEPELAAAHAS